MYTAEIVSTTLGDTVTPEFLPAHHNAVKVKKCGYHVKCKVLLT